MHSGRRIPGTGSARAGVVRQQARQPAYSQLVRHDCFEANLPTGGGERSLGWGTIAGVPPLAYTGTAACRVAPGTHRGEAGPRQWLW